MKFLTVRFSAFRNLQDAVVEVPRPRVILVGENGQGKTNFLEALHFLCYGSSFRTRNLREVAAHGRGGFAVGGTFEDKDGREREVLVRYADGRKAVLLDGKEIKDRREMIHNIPCVVFSYDDMSLVTGEPECRRNFFDQTLSMGNPLYLDDLGHYKSILKHRNAALKDGLGDLLAPYNILLARYGLRIKRERARIAEVFAGIFPGFYQSVAGDGRRIRLDYRPSWGDLDSEDAIASRLEEEAERDFAAQSTTSGIHRDRFVISDQNGLFCGSGSTGQLRLASLVLKAAQAICFRRQTGTDPVMLMDDVMLELDSGRRGEFLSSLGPSSQAFFTFLSNERYFSDDRPSDGLVLRVRDGRFEEER